MNFVEKEKIYAFLIKIKQSNGEYKMAGYHGIWYSKSLNIEDIHNLYEMVKEKLNNFIDDYSDDEIDIIQIMFIELNPLPKLKLRNINKLNLDKKLVK